MKLTQEQKDIVSCNLAAGQVLKVLAFAGTGKTTTLIEYALAHPEKRILYVAFNKSVQLEAAAKFPRNVVCKTSHALAFARFGARHRNRLVPGFKANTVMDALDLANYEDAKFAIDTLLNYLVSADPRVSQRHVPHVARPHYQQVGLAMPNLVDLANKLGRMMCDGSNPNIGMLHDGYLKLFQLSRPRLNFDILLLDEAQDVNPCTADIILSQPGVAKIVVGDHHQQIYSFRGSRDSLKTIEADFTCYLTNSFRFTNNIARAANMILDQFKGETRKIQGLRKKAKGRGNGKYTMVARTNAKVFDEAVRLSKNRKKVGFVGGIAGYRFNRILDCYYLYTDKKRKIRDPYLRSFDNFGDMESYAKTVEDCELGSMCKVVLNYRHTIYGLVEMIQEKAVDESMADVILVTGHKAKGLEWPEVHLCDDFPELVVDKEIIGKDELETDEFNLLYVSMTRAMERLRFMPGNCMIDFIERYQEKMTGKKGKTV